MLGFVRVRGDKRKKGKKNAAMREAASVVSSSLIVVSKMFGPLGQRGNKDQRNCSYMHVVSYSQHASFFDWSTAYTEGQRGNLNPVLGLHECNRPSSKLIERSELSSSFRALTD